MAAVKVTTDALDAAKGSAGMLKIENVWPSHSNNPLEQSSMADFPARRRLRNATL